MGDSIRLLHVDDDPETREVTQTVLEKEVGDINVLSASSPASAIDCLETEPVDCVLSDYKMPTMDGLELLSAVRDRWPNLPFILYTAKGSEDIASEAISSGVTDYMRKADSIEEYQLLGRRINAATEGQRARESERVADLVRTIQSDLVRARSQERIHEAVCDRLIEADPYEFAWIGTVGNDTAKVLPVASAGQADGYLEDMEVTTDDSKTGQGPTGTAVKTASIQVVRAIATESTYEPWREQALDRGFESSAAVPIEYQGTLYGVLNVYADRPNVFDSDTQAVLEELSHTIAHAIYRVDVQERVESQYEDLFEDAPVMMAFTREEDGEPIVGDCNRRFAEKLGYAPEELRERPLAELYTDESADLLLDKGGYQRALDGDFSPKEREFVTAGGERLTTLLQASPRRNDEGDVIGTQALYVDISARKRAQSVLEQAEAMEASMDGMAILDEDEEFVYLNQAHADIFGYDDPEALIGESWRALNDESELGRFETETDAALRETGEWRGETTGVRVDGTTVPLEVSLTRVSDGSVVATVRDISERKAREEELERKTDLFEQAQEIADLGAWETNLEQNEGWWTEKVNRILGLPAEYEPVPAEGLNYFHPEDRATIRHAYGRATREGEPFDLEVRVGDEDSTRWVRTRGVPQVENGDVVRIRGTTQDITERKQRERELERARKRMRVLFEKAPDAIAVHDADGEVLDVNEQNLDNLGYSREELLSMNVTDFDAGIDSEEIRKQWAAMDVGGTLKVEGEHERKDGSTFPVEVWVSKVEIDGEPRFFGLGRDITERKERERELSRYQAFVENSSDVITILGGDGTVEYASPASTRVSGHDPETLMGADAIEYVHPDDQAEMMENLEELIANPERSITSEYRFRHRDGSWIWVESTGINRLDDPLIEGVVLVSREVTERKEREQKLKQFQEAVEQTAHAVYITDTDGTIEYVNPAFEEISGYDRAEALGQEPHILHSGEHSDEYFESFWSTIRAGEQWEDEMVNQRADGDRIILHQTVSPITDEDGDPQKFVTVAQDITERKNYEKALEQARQELRQIIDLVPDLIFVKNREGEYVLANETTAEAYGMTTDELEGKPESAVIPESEDSEGFHEDDLEVINSGEPKEIPAEELTTASGETRILQTTKIPYEVPGSDEETVLGYCRDVTDLKEYEQQLESQRDNLEVLNQVVRHDIRNDIQLVLAYAEQLQNIVEGDGREYVDQVVEAARDAVDITTTARDVTKVMLQSDVDRHPVRVRSVLGDEVDDVRASNENAVVTVEGAIPDVTVLADDMLSSVFRNLLSNAIQHNDRDIPEVTASVTRTDDSVAVRIADNGPGISDERKETIFEQGEMGLDSGGTGLGLYLVETLVDRYGGSVHVEDNDPEGAVFVVDLPIYS